MKLTNKQMWKLRHINVSPNSDIKHGDVFTLAGYKLNKNGGITSNCKPGQETKFIAVVKDR